MPFIITATCLALIAAVYLFLVAPSLKSHPDKKALDGMYIAHRGLHDAKQGVPENSMKAFRRAIEAGYTIENDIHLTADGEVVIFHDDTLDRVCGVSGKIEEKTLKELKELRLLGTDEGIPTLKECLGIVDGKVQLFIEFKVVGSNAAYLCQRANEILKGYGGKYYIQSFYPNVLMWYKNHRPDVCRGQLSTAFKGEAFYKRLLGCLVSNVAARPHFVSYEWKYPNKLSRRMTALLGANPVCWTLRSKQELQTAKKDFKTFIFEDFDPKE